MVFHCSDSLSPPYSTGAPEIYYGAGYHKSVDWWSYGCLVHELLAGYTPFENAAREQDVLSSIIRYSQC